MPSFLATGLALLAAVGAVSADYGYGYGYASSTVHKTTHAAPAPTYHPTYPYYNGTEPYHPHGTAHPHPVDYTTTTVCETKYHTDSAGHTTYTEVIPIYTTVCPLTTSTIYKQSTYVSVGVTYTKTYSVGQTVYPVTTYYPPAPAATATGTGKIYPVYAKGAASSLQVSGLAAVVVVMVAAAL